MQLRTHLARHRPALATAASVMGVLLLLGGKAATSDPAALAGTNTPLAASDQGSVDGPVIETRYGPVQVRVTVRGGTITALQSVRLPSGGRSGDIAAWSAPILEREALAAQGAGIQAVSGATYTSEGYAQSLQAALDEIAGQTSAGQAGST